MASDNQPCVFGSGANDMDNKEFGNLTDEQELELLSLTTDRKPCIWIEYGRIFGYVCDTLCPIRQKVIEDFEERRKEKEHNKFRKEYPDES